MLNIPLLTPVDRDKERSHRVLSLTFACPRSGQRKVVRCTLCWLSLATQDRPLAQFGFWAQVFRSAEVAS
jgi:hypothetical protein